MPWYSRWSVVQPSACPLAIAAREPKSGRGGALLPAQSRQYRPPPSAHPGCSFGIDVTQRPCTHPRCSVCTICSGSFDLQLAGSGRRAIHLTSLCIHLSSHPSIHLSIHLPIYLSIHPSRPGAFFRYGRGLYFSKVSSKSNDYAAASERRDPHSLQRGAYRLMFLCRVAAGEAARSKCPTSQPPTATHRSRGSGVLMAALWTFEERPRHLDAKERRLPKVTNAAAS